MRFYYREHGVVGDMRDAWPNARVRKNVSLIHTYHGFKGIHRGFSFLPEIIYIIPSVVSGLFAKQRKTFLKENLTTV
jgi:hypothetical protein